MEPSEDPLNAAFAALSDPTRRAILEQLADGEAPVGDLAAPFDISPQAISRHLKVLEQSGLVTRRIDKQKRIIRLNAAAMKQPTEWMNRYRAYWEGKFDQLDAYLDAKTKDGEQD